MDLGINGRTALVLGASGGLGRAIAVRLAEEGANVAAAGRSADKLADTVTRIEAAGVKSVALEWDLGDLDSVDRHVSEIEFTGQGLNHHSHIVEIAGDDPVAHRGEGELDTLGAEIRDRRHSRHLDLLLGRRFDASDQAGLTRLGEGDRHAFAPGTTGPADAVDIGVRR